MKLNSYPLLLTTSVATLSSASSFDPTNRDSVAAAAKQIASGLFSFYDSEHGVGLFGKRALWWESGSAHDALINYWFLTGDATYNSDVENALIAQSDLGFQPLNQTASITNDEQAIWALAGVTAAERGFPSINGTNYIDLSITAFESLLARWDNGTQNSCGIPAGGLRMGLFTFDTLYEYKNTLSTALFFQLSARLARYTGNATYTDAAVMTYDWLEQTGLVDADGFVYDGLTDYSSSSSSWSSSSSSSYSPSSSGDCSDSSNFDHLQWSHTPAALLEGAFIMANITTNSVWRTRSLTLLSGIENVFYPTSPNAVPATSKNNNASVLVEVACEPVATCNTEQTAFKGLAARWLVWAAVSAPAAMNIPARVAGKISGTASAAQQRCEGAELCAGRWFDLSEERDVGDISSFTGLGQQLSAFDAVLAPLVNGSIVLRRSNSKASVNGSAVSTLTGTGTATSTAGARQTGAATQLLGMVGGQLLALVMAVVVMGLAL
ncbi:glycoside hydrolase [Phyllosticta citrichinensis]|uniref:Mannan endo-1,6-alpha-mannosidase n=1 Tax=Phyllosticta citrichinensis TaxID=1130410 RepID=A0ABR1XWM1_9PEZI